MTTKQVLALGLACGLISSTVLAMGTPHCSTTLDDTLHRRGIIRSPPRRGQSGEPSELGPAQARFIPSA